MAQASAKHSVWSLKIASTNFARSFDSVLAFNFTLPTSCDVTSKNRIRQKKKGQCTPNLVTD